ncbi:RidA family protein [Xylophilus rhododendri]|uniref:RidA family protein n=1 Tax=Xylophilus rhododendri TaxID=2697032 RepID=A0A857J492_9BURK|nr:RidA family protein [Xylophilus rhododendri]QHI98477.1 RidA family protein [Xylophilus rhododendri]
MPLEYLGVPPVASDRQARPFSPAVRAGDFVYVSGQVPVDAGGEIVTGGIEAQTRQVMENVKAALALAGATLDDVCKSNCWLDDARDFGAFNRIYLSYFPNGKPARSTTEARLMIDAKVEIDVIAYSPASAARG